jgi:hypothetical protein
MNALGYVWRDNGACLTGTTDPHADFIYAGGAVTGHGVVLAEAHGSFAQSVTGSRMSGEAKRKYRRQVKPHIAGICAHGEVIHGYAVAFGSNPTSQRHLSSCRRDENREAPRSAEIVSAANRPARTGPRPYVARARGAQGEFSAHGRIERCRLDRLAAGRRRTPRRKRHHDILCRRNLWKALASRCPIFVALLPALGSARRTGSAESRVAERGL